MKQKIFAGVSFISMLLIISSCNVFDIIDIDFSTEDLDVIVEVQPISSGEYYEAFDSIDSDIKKQIEDHGGKIENLQSIKIQQLTIEMESGADNFNAFKNAEVIIRADGLEDKKLAWTNEILLNLTKLYPESTSDNLKDFLEIENYSVIVSGEAREDIVDPVKLKVTIKYEVTL